MARYARVFETSAQAWQFDKMLRNEGNENRERLLEVIIMRQREDTDQHTGPLEAQQAARKPYRKPALRHEQVFETRALTCGKVQATQAACHYERKAS